MEGRKILREASIGMEGRKTLREVSIIMEGRKTLEEREYKKSVAKP